MNSTHRPFARAARRLVAAACCTALLAGAVAAGAAPPSDDPPIAARYAAGWLADQVTEDGSVTGGFNPLGDAGATALALAAAGVEDAAFDRALGHVVANAEAFVAPSGADDPGRLGRALLLAEISGTDPGSFGGIDLVARLGATLGDLEPGLYGAANPTFDGVLRQSLAILGLTAVGAPVPTEAIDWLVGQQCGAATASATGGWEAYRADTATPCAAPDAATFAGPDSNATGYALMALDAVGEEPSFDALAYLASVQSAEGGWSQQGVGNDPNSTAIVIQALLGRGLDPEAFGNGGAHDALLGWVVPCGEDGAGAFASPFSNGAPDVFANLDGILGAAGATWPLDGPVELGGPVGDPCAEEPTDPEDPGDPDDPEDPADPGDTGSPTGPGTTPAPPAASPQPVRASFTG